MFLQGATVTPDFIHFYLRRCSRRGGSFQLDKACLFLLTESDSLRQRIMHDIAELTVGRHFLPVLAICAHVEFVRKAIVGLASAFRGAISKCGEFDFFAQINGQRRSSHLFP